LVSILGIDHVGHSGHHYTHGMVGGSGGGEKRFLERFRDLYRDLKCVTCLWTDAGHIPTKDVLDAVR
jgi:hypothetical protein